MSIETVDLLVTESNGNGTVVGQLGGYDVEGDALTYSLVDDAEGRFAIDESTGQITIANDSLIDYEEAVSHTVTVALSDGTGTTTQSYTINIQNTNDVAEISPEVAPNPDVVAAYDMTSIEDISGNNSDASLGDGAVIADGKVDLNGAGGNLGAIQMGGAITIATSFTYDSFHTWARIVDFGNGNNADNIVIGSTAEGTISVDIYQGAGSVKTMRVSDFYELGEEFHLALTIDDNGHMSLYKDGALMGENPNGHTPNDVMRTNNYIGQSNLGEAGTQGSMSDLVLLNRSLDSTEVSDLYDLSLIHI